jgi:hypothetical protein
VCRDWVLNFTCHTVTDPSAVRQRRDDRDLRGREVVDDAVADADSRGGVHVERRRVRARGRVDPEHAVVPAPEEAAAAPSDTAADLPRVHHGACVTMGVAQPP